MTQYNNIADKYSARKTDEVKSLIYNKWLKACGNIKDKHSVII